MSTLPRRSVRVRKVPEKVSETRPQVEEEEEEEEGGRRVVVVSSSPRRHEY